MTSPRPTHVIHFTLVNRDTNVRFSEYTIPADKYCWTGEYSPGEVFRTARSEFGRCISKVYNESPVPQESGGKTWKTIHTGWVFESRQRYEDTGEPYLREAWVTIYEHVPPVPVELGEAA